MQSEKKASFCEKEGIQAWTKQLFSLTSGPVTVHGERVRGHQYEQ